MVITSRDRDRTEPTGQSLAGRTTWWRRTPSSAPSRDDPGSGAEPYDAFRGPRLERRTQAGEDGTGGTRTRPAQRLAHVREAADEGECGVEILAVIHGHVDITELAIGEACGREDPLDRRSLSQREGIRSGRCRDSAFADAEGLVDRDSPLVPVVRSPDHHDEAPTGSDVPNVRFEVGRCAGTSLSIRSF